MKRILLIDDDPQDRLLYRRFLEQQAGLEGMEIAEASSGEEGLALFDTFRPDCVLLDYYLPDTDGLAMLHGMARLVPAQSLCVVMITGQGSEILAVRAFKSGALDYLVKQQFDPEMLYQTMLNAIEKNEWRQYMARYQEELQAANAQITARNHELTRTNADLDTFIYTASHDLKAPITNIEGLLAALGRHLPEAARQAPPVPQLLQLMQEAVERFQRTIAQLTDLTRLQQAQQQPAESVDLAGLIEAVRLDLAPVLAAAGAQVVVAVADCPTVRFAPQHLRSIVYNLLSNAVKYRHPDRPPVVRVRCRPGAAGTVVLEVEDNGLGLSEGQQARLFGLFQRLHTHVEGTGVGLYMLKRIVDNADGTIAVRSQLGLGTTFTITLPD